MKKLFLVGCLLSLLTLDAQEPKLVLAVGKQGRSLTAAVSPDARKIATFDASNSINVWDAQTGYFLTTVQTPAGPTAAVRFHPNNQELLVATDSFTHVVNMLTGALQHSFKSPGGVYFSAINKAGDRLLAGGANSISLYHYTTRQALLVYTTEQTVFGADFSADGTTFVFATSDSLFIHDGQTGNRIRATAGRFAMVKPVVSPNGKFVFTSYGSDGALYELPSGKLLHTLAGHSETINHAAFHPDSKQLATCADDSTVKLWSLITGKLTGTLKGHYGEVNHVAYNDDGSRLASTALDKTATNSRHVFVWNPITQKKTLDIPFNRLPVNTASFSNDGSRLLVDFLHTEPPHIVDAVSGDLLASLKPTTAHLSDAAFSKDGTRIFSLFSDNICRIWDIKKASVQLTSAGAYYREVYTGFYSPDFKKVLVPRGLLKMEVWDTSTKKMVLQIDTANQPTWGQFSPDGKLIATASLLLDSTEALLNSPKLWDAETGVLRSTLAGHKAGVRRVRFSDDGSRLITASEDRSAKIWDVQTGGELFHLPHNATVKLAAFSPQNRFALTLTEDNSINVWNLQNGQLQTTITGVDDELKNVFMSPDFTSLLTVSETNTLKWWDLESRKDRFQFFAAGKQDHFILSNEGYYLCSREAAKQLYYVTKDLEIVSFAQLDVKYNRPDKVLAAVGSPDTSLASAYQRAWQKRMKRLAIDTASLQKSFVVPELSLVNRASIPFQQAGDKLTLRLRAKDSVFLLDRFTVWVNEVPLFGVRGISLRDRKTRLLDTTITLTLAQGLNVIEAAVTNTNGTESYRTPIQVRYRPLRPKKEKLYFIGLGIDRFQDARQNLNYAAKDVRDLALRLKKVYKDGLVIDTLFNEQVTVANITALRQKLRQTTVNDKVILSYSGHGLLSGDYDYYLSTYAVNFQQPQENGLAYEALESLLDSIPARKKLLLIDACHSGEVDKEELQHYQLVVNQKAGEGLRGGGVVNTDSTAKVGIKNSFALMQELFVNVGRSTGATIISAAAGTQLAQERGELKNGVFTYAILELMQQQKTATVSELKQYVNRRVTELTNGLQVPTTRAETKRVDWSVW